MKMSGRSNRTKFRDQVLKPLLEANLIEMTIPEKLTNSKQHYRITARGKQHLTAKKKQSNQYIQPAKHQVQGLAGVPRPAGSPSRLAFIHPQT